MKDTLVTTSYEDFLSQYTDPAKAQETLEGAGIRFIQKPVYMTAQKAARGEYPPEQQANYGKTLDVVLEWMEKVDKTLVKFQPDQAQDESDNALEAEAVSILLQPVIAQYGNMRISVHGDFRYLGAMNYLGITHLGDSFTLEQLLKTLI